MEFCKKKEWVPFYDLNVFFMANLFFLLFLFMFNFIKIGTNMLKKEDWQHQSNKYANVLRDSKETPTQSFSYELCQVFKNTFFIEHLRWLLLAMGAPYLVMLQVTLNLIYQGL